MKKPLIGIVLDIEPGGEYSPYPYYVLRRDYFAAVSKVGGIPIAIPVSEENLDDYFERLDGLLLPGGDYDIPPSFYGTNEVHESVVTKPGRLHFDMTLAQKFYDADKPILGICLGEQLLAVLLGGSLHQDIETELKGALPHYDQDRLSPSHKLIITPNTILHSIFGDSVAVNSHHHQAVKAGSGKFVVSAVSEDGVIEAIEAPEKKFCVGVQWHPEHLVVEKEIEIFKRFVDACK